MGLIVQRIQDLLNLILRLYLAFQRHGHFEPSSCPFLFITCQKNAILAKVKRQHMMTQVSVVIDVSILHQGSARQLFQRLQGPMEEDTLKAHFKIIIRIGQHLHSHKSQVCSLLILKYSVGNFHKFTCVWKLMYYFSVNPVEGHLVFYTHSHSSQF